MGARSGRRDAVKAEVLRRIFTGYDVERLDKLGRAFAFDVMRRHLRAETVDRVDWHRTQGHRLVIVSASLGVYVRPIAERLRFDAVLATELEVGIDGKLTGRLDGANVRGAEKARRLDVWLGGEPHVRVGLRRQLRRSRAVGSRRPARPRLEAQPVHARPRLRSNDGQELATLSGSLGAQCTSSSKPCANACSIFDGAFGTWVQGQQLGPDDFGGEALEGCNEYLVLSRPDLIRQMHREYFDVGVDAVETATFGAFGVVLAEYDIAEKTYELNETAARLAKEVAAEYSSGRASPLRDRVDWSRHQAPVARPHRVRHAARLLRTPDRGVAGRRGRRRCSSKPCRICSRARRL